MMNNITKILFVCHGNICRSPMAEFVMKELLGKCGKSDLFYVESAATSTEELGNPVYPPAREVMLRHGIDCSGKYARQIRSLDYAEFDYIIGMDRRNLTNMLRFWGSDPEGKISLLMSYTGSDREVADPWYTGNFDATWNDINSGCSSFLNKILLAD